MKAVKVDVGGEEYYLLFNGAAMFEVDERFDSSAKLLDLLNQNSRSMFDALCWVVALLAEQGELVRRCMGYDPGEMLAEETIRALATPTDIMELRRAVVNAIMLGYGREEGDGGEVDLGLAELNQKKRKR